MDQSKQERLCEALEVDGFGGKQGLNFHVFKSAPGGSGHPAQGFGQSMHVFDQPAVKGVEVGFVATPRQPFSASTQDINTGPGDMDTPGGAAIGDASRARSGQVRQASAPARNQRPDLVAERGVITFLRGQRTISRAAS